MSETEPTEPTAIQTIRPAPAPLKPVPFQPTDTGEMYRYAGFISKSSLVPTALIGKPQNVLLVLLKGWELGLKPMQSIGNIHIVEGKAEVGAHLMLAMVLQQAEVCEYFYCEDSGGAGEEAYAVYVTRRKGWPEGRESRVRWDVPRAIEAGLYGRATRSGKPGNWDRMPLTMCKRRAQAELCRDVYPDIVMGMYDFGELTETRDPDDAIDITPAGGVPAPATPPTLLERVKTHAQGGADDPLTEPEWMDPTTEVEEEGAPEVSDVEPEPEPETPDEGEKSPPPLEEWTRDQLADRAVVLGINPKGIKRGKLLDLVRAEEDLTRTVADRVNPPPMTDEEKAEARAAECEGQQDLEV